MSTRRKTLLAIVMLPIVMLLTVASIGLASAHPAQKAAQSAVHPAAKKPKIVISSFTFTVPKSVKPGSKILVINKDGVDHTVTSDDGTSFSVVTPAHSKVKMIAPASTGSYAFHCAIHATMKGTLVVKSK